MQSGVAHAIRSCSSNPELLIRSCSFRSWACNPELLMQSGVAHPIRSCSSGVAHSGVGSFALFRICPTRGNFIVTFTMPSCAGNNNIFRVSQATFTMPSYASNNNIFRVSQATFTIPSFVGNNNIFPVSQVTFTMRSYTGTMQSNNVRPRRVWVPQREATKSSASNLGPTEGPRKTEQEVPGNDSITQMVNTESQHVPIVDGQKKVQFSFGSNSRSRGADDLMASGTDSLLSHMGSLALAEMIWDGSNQPKDQMHQFRNFLHGNLNHPVTQLSIVGSSCATTTVVNSASAPIINSMTYCLDHSENMVSNMPVAPMGDCNVDPEQMSQENVAHPSCNSCQRTTFAILLKVEEYDMAKELQGRGPEECEFRKDCAPLDDNPNNGKELESGVTDLQSQPSSKNPPSDMKAEPPKS
ncbi:hypothetical protein Vadar_031294 [Vaccinium darrowii]|uniref:Uncharacterized protein n=1 Tax=Vaccinium darrowii TaxID=229202 RepID=A0ACB7XVG1_9ERIC|nr:hypothetical protein Vadar_031294 [Vaccinium darrowii]